MFVLEVLFFWNPPFLVELGEWNSEDRIETRYNTPCCCMVLGSLDPTDGFGPPIWGVRSWSSKRSSKNASGLLLIARFCSRKARVSWLLLPSFGLSLNLAWMYAEVQSIWSVQIHSHSCNYPDIYSWISINCGSFTMICPTSIIKRFRMHPNAIYMLFARDLCSLQCSCIFGMTSFGNVSCSKHDRPYSDSTWYDGQRFRPLEVQGQPCRTS